MDPISALADEYVLILEEDGIQIFFKDSSENEKQRYSTSEYWLIPAHTATSDVEWSGPGGEPDMESPIFALFEVPESLHAPSRIS